MLIVRTTILEALWQAAQSAVPTASALCLNLYFPKPSATIHARSNTPLILAGQHGGDPQLIAKRIKEQLMEGWGNQFSTTITTRGTLAFQLTDSYIWSHVAESVQQELPNAITEATQAAIALSFDLLQTIELAIIHLDGVMVLLAEQGFLTNAEDSFNISSMSPSSHPPLTPLLCSLLVLPEYLAQATGSSKQPLFAAAMQHLLQTFNSYRAIHPLLSKKNDGFSFQAMVGSFILLMECLCLVEKNCRLSLE